MNGSSTSSARVSTAIRPQTRASALSEVGERLDLVPERVEPHPGLARVVAGLVHHPPLVAAEVLGAGLVLQVGAVGQQQQGRVWSVP